MSAILLPVSVALLITGTMFFVKFVCSIFFQSWPKILLLKLENQDHFSVIRQNYLNVVPIRTHFILEILCRLPDDRTIQRVWNHVILRAIFKKILRRRHTVLRTAFKFSLHYKYCLKYLYLYVAKQKNHGNWFIKELVVRYYCSSDFCVWMLIIM